MLDPCGAKFWGALFDAYPDSASSQAVVGQLLSMFGHRDRSLRAAAMCKMEPLLAALQRAKGEFGTLREKREREKKMGGH
jgi:hypothetical protein